MSLVDLTEIQAHQRADWMAERLSEKLGGDWKPKTWHNNLYWCYNATLGSISVYEYAENKFSALVSDKPNEAYGGAAHWTHNTQFVDGKWRPMPYKDTPEEAVIEAMKIATERWKQYTQAINGNLMLMTNVDLKVFFEPQ